MLSKYRLPGMLSGEKIILVGRRSFFIFLKKIFFLSALAAIPAPFAFLVLVNYPSVFGDPVIFPIIVLAASAYYLFIWLFSFFSFIDYYLDIFAITSDRIINIKQEGFFARTISEQHIDKVQDVTSEVEGVFKTLFKYGDITVQTASEQEKMFFHDISNPEGVRDIIIRLADEKKHGHDSL